MKQLRTLSMTPVRMIPGLLSLVLVLAPISGCQSMMAKSKTKQLQAQDKFSCGETLPGRPGTVRGSAIRSAE